MKRAAGGERSRGDGSGRDALRRAVFAVALVAALAGCRHKETVASSPGVAPDSAQAAAVTDEEAAKEEKKRKKREKRRHALHAIGAALQEAGRAQSGKKAVDCVSVTEGNVTRTDCRER